MQNNSGDFYPPQLYAQWWTLLGLCALGVVILWILWVFWLTRKKSGRAAVPAIPPAPVSVQNAYLQKIDEVEALARGGKISEREAHQRLSLLLRSFVHEVTGVDAPRMTLQELRSAVPAAVADAVALVYPAEFGVHGRGEVESSAQAFRQVIWGWN
ncbi:hypothetical protein ACQR35_04475 [Pseudarthrobacter sp. J1738]|uniref:hypothetical protein n=1 Tax=Pseudarthrobacter sp. J1738 TaxID=3420446 RepID=UPI003D2B6057